MLYKLNFGDPGGSYRSIPGSSLSSEERANALLYVGYTCGTGESFARDDALHEY